MLHKYCKKIVNLTLFHTQVLVTFTHYPHSKTAWNLSKMQVKMFSYYLQKINLFSFLSFSLLPLATGNIYSSISKIGQHNPTTAFEGYISKYSDCDFQIPHAKIYPNVNFQLITSCEFEDILILVSLRTLLSIMLGENSFWSAIFNVWYLGPYLSE